MAYATLEEATVQVTDKRIHQVKIEFSLKECLNLRKAIDHYLKFYDWKLLDEKEHRYVEKDIDLDTLRAMVSHLRLVETSNIVEELSS